MNDKRIDRSAIARLLDVIGGDPDDLKELVEEFHASAPDLVGRMETAASGGDIDGLRIATHSLKANGRDFGAVALAEMCERLEHECRNGAVEDGAAQVAAIADELSAVRTALDGVIAHE